MSADISLCQLTEPDIMASPYRFYRELREADPVHWDPFLHSWAVTRYVPKSQPFDPGRSTSRAISTAF